MDLFEIYVICAAILVGNLLFLANGTAVTRAKAGKFRNPEDGKLNKTGQLQEDDDGMTARYRRAHLNALENILPWLPMAYLYVATKPSTTIATILLVGFTGFRLLHSFAYIKRLQPWRTIGFGVAALILVGTVGATVYNVLAA